MFRARTYFKKSENISAIYCHEDEEKVSEIEAEDQISFERLKTRRVSFSSNLRWPTKLVANSFDVILNEDRSKGEKKTHVKTIKRTR